MASVFERLAVLVEHGLEELQEGIALGQSEQLGSPPVCGDRSEQALGPGRFDSVELPNRLEQRPIRKIEPGERGGEARDEDRPIERQRRALDDPDPLELEHLAVHRDPKGLRLDLIRVADTGDDDLR